MDNGCRVQAPAQSSPVDVEERQRGKGKKVGGGGGVQVRIVMPTAALFPVINGVPIQSSPGELLIHARPRTYLSWFQAARVALYTDGA